MAAINTIPNKYLYETFVLLFQLIQGWKSFSSPNVRSILEK